MDVKNPSYIHRPVDFQYHCETVPERLEYFAQKYGDREVYVFLHPDGRRESITAKQLFKKSRELAHSLIALGIGKGDIVTTCLYNDLDLLLCTFGTICTGAIILNTIIKNEDGSDLKEKLQKLHVKCLILNPGEQNQQLKACMNFITDIGKDGSVECKSVPSLKVFISTAPVEGNELLQLTNLFIDPGQSFRLSPLDSERTIVLLPTSGSTGESKFVPHSHHDSMIIGHHLKESVGYEFNDVVYNERRIAWLGGFPFTYLHDAVKVVTKTKPFDSLSDHCEFTYNAMLQEKCTVACLFPATIIGLLEKLKKMSKPSTFLLKSIHVGGLPVASVCMNAIGVLSETVINGYGSSEGGYFTFNRVNRKEDYLNYCTGIPLAGLELKVVDTDGFVLERGNMGTVHVRSPCLFWYYYKDETKTKEALSDSHWMDTGDMGYITDDGKLVVCGRTSDIIMQAGRYIIPSKIEAFIKTHSDVLDCVVVSIPDDTMFEQACACVIPFPGKNLSADDIKRFYSKGIMSFSEEAFTHGRPEVVIFESFPTVYTGKPDKAALKREVMLRLHQQ